MTVANVQMVKYMRVILNLKSLEEYIQITRICAYIIVPHYLCKEERITYITKVGTMTKPDVG